MEQTYIVVFENAQLDNVENYLKSLGTWGKITDLAWVVVTAKTATQIRDELLPKINTGGRVFVVRSGTLAAWNNAKANSDWLKRHL